MVLDSPKPYTAEEMRDVVMEMQITGEMKLAWVGALEALC